jgi:hypothetical protein
MTVFFELRSLINSVRERQIAITQVLERLANDPEVRKRTRDLVAEAHTFDGDIPAWLRDLMLEEGLSEEEVAHAGRWPDAQKEIARMELLNAYDNEQPVHFAWDLHRGIRRFTKVNERDNGETEIVFSDPKQRLTVGAGGGVTVETDINAE